MNEFNDFNLGIFVFFVLVCATLITWITKLRRENLNKDEQIDLKDEEISIKDRAIEYQKRIIDRLQQRGSNGKHG